MTQDTTVLEDRRRRRSTDPLVALHYQLAQTRARGDLDAIVVADATGVVVAGSGSWPVCEELAAYAPLLADAADTAHGAPSSPRVESLRPTVEIRTLAVGGQEILLCARRPRREETSNVQYDLDQAAAGVCRILESAAA